MSEKSEDPVLKRMREAFTVSGLSLEELGHAMGIEGKTARKSSWQLLNMVNDPRIGTLRKFAKAVGVPLDELLSDKKKSRSN